MASSPHPRSELGWQNPKPGSIQPSSYNRPGCRARLKECPLVSGSVVSPGPQQPAPHPPADAHLFPTTAHTSLYIFPPQRKPPDEKPLHLIPQSKRACRHPVALSPSAHSRRRLPPVPRTMSPGLRAHLLRSTSLLPYFSSCSRGSFPPAPPLFKQNKVKETAPFSPRQSGLRCGSILTLPRAFLSRTPHVTWLLLSPSSSSVWSQSPQLCLDSRNATHLCPCRGAVHDEGKNELHSSDFQTSAAHQTSARYQQLDVLKETNRNCRICRYEKEHLLSILHANYACKKQHLRCFLLIERALRNKALQIFHTQLASTQ